MLNELAHKRQILATLPNTIHNPLSDHELSWRTNFLNQNCVQYIDCFFFSLLIEKPNDTKVSQRFLMLFRFSSYITVT